MSEQPKEYIIDILKVDKKLDVYVDDFATFSKREKRETVEEIHNIIIACSRPHPAPAPKFNSTELLLLAHDEWKRREERKHLHNEQDWVSGFINGFLTDPVWARKMVDTIRANAQHPSTKGGEHL